MAEALRDGNHVPTMQGVSSSDGTTPVNIYADPNTHRMLVTIGGALSLLEATGSVNSVNKDFVFTNTPTVIVSDGVTYRVNKGFSWNSGTLTATMDLPPNFDLFGII